MISLVRNIKKSMNRTTRPEHGGWISYPTEKEMKLQRYIQSLHQDLQVAHQSKVSLQEAQVEANKQGMILYTHTL